MHAAVLRRFLCLNSYIQVAKNCYKISTLRNIKTLSSVYNSSQQSTYASQSTRNNTLVYEAPLKTRIKVVKYLSLSSSMFGFAVFPSVIMDLSKLNIAVACGVSVISIFFLSTPFMLHWVTKRYVLELCFDNETEVFTAKTYNIINQIKEIKFKATDVTVPDLPGMLSSFLVNGKPLFVDANLIQDPDVYSHMMGYDKPFDIALKVEQDNDNKVP